MILWRDDGICVHGLGKRVLHCIALGSIRRSSFMNTAAEVAGSSSLHHQVIAPEMAPLILAPAYPNHPTAAKGDTCPPQSPEKQRSEPRQPHRTSNRPRATAVPPRASQRAIDTEYCRTRGLRLCRRRVCRWVGLGGGCGGGGGGLDASDRDVLRRANERMSRCASGLLLRRRRLRLRRSASCFWLVVCLGEWSELISS